MCSLIHVVCAPTDKLCVDKQGVPSCGLFGICGVSLAAPGTGVGAIAPSPPPPPAPPPPVRGTGLRLRPTLVLVGPATVLLSVNDTYVPCVGDNTEVGGWAGGDVKTIAELMHGTWSTVPWL